MQSRSPLRAVLALVAIAAVVATGVGCTSENQAADSAGSGDEAEPRIFDVLFGPEYTVTARSVNSCSPTSQSRFRGDIAASVNGGSTRLLAFYDNDISSDQSITLGMDKLIRLDSGDELCVFSIATDEVGPTSDNRMTEDEVCLTVESDTTMLDFDLQMLDDDTACAVEVAVSTNLEAVTEGEVFQPIDALASGSLPSPPRPATLLIDGSELSGSGPLVFQTHGNGPSAEGMWHSAGFPGFPNLPPDVNIQWLRFELGESRDLEGAYIWNQNQAGLTGRGIRDFRIRVSNSPGPTGIVWTTIGDFEIDEACDCPTANSQFVKFEADDVKWVRFEVISVWSGQAREWVGLSEVAFVGDLTPVP